MTRRREGVDLYAGRDDFKGFDELKEWLSRARPKDSTLDYAQRRGLDIVCVPLMSNVTASLQDVRDEQRLR